MSTDNNGVKEVLFLGFVSKDYSRSSTLSNYDSPGVIKKYQQIGSNNISIIRELAKIRNKLSNRVVIVVSSPCHKIVIFGRLILRQKIILDAGWPLTDGVISRGISFRKIGKLIQSYLLDLFSFHFADLILVESRTQLVRIHWLFAVPKHRIRVSFTGVNERAFPPLTTDMAQNSKIITNLSLLPQTINVLFRGKINRESGIENIIRAAKTLESEANFFLVINSTKSLKDIPSNCFLYSDVSFAEMSAIYSMSDVALGQISRHRRLRYTIPHKAFEAGFFGITYITTKSASILELYPEQSVYYIEDSSVSDLVDAIRSLKDISLRKAFQTRISERYAQCASQEVLNYEFSKLILEL